MSKAEDRADEITRAALDYCNNIEDMKPTDDFRRRICIAMGQSFIKGAEWADKHQAEKDLALTWEDVKKLDDLMNEISYDTLENDSFTIEDVYKEALKRFEEERSKR